MRHVHTSIDRTAALRGFAVLTAVALAAAPAGAAEEPAPQETVITVGEMCGGCVKRIEAKLKPVDAIAGVRCDVQKKTVTVTLRDFVTNYTQDDLESVEDSLRKKGSQVVMENGQIIKLSKDKNGVLTRQLLTEDWRDWIDYWSVDFNYDSKKEIINVPDGKGGFEPQWTGGYIFENEWQSFRTKQDRSLEFTSAPRIYDEPGTYRIMVKVVDILGVDTSQLLEVTVK